MPPRLAPDVRNKIFLMLEEGYSKPEIARRMGVHYNTVVNMKRGIRPTQLEDAAQQALKDFGLFRTRYMGRVATPWQTNAANVIVDLLATEDEEYLVINCPPGSGKSTLLTDICCWVLARDRATRILYGSASQSVASDYTRRIMNDLEREEITRASSKELARGLAVDGQATMQKDFGRFKPANGDRWTKEKFVIAQAGGRTAQEKEASVAAFGRDSTFLGGRYDLNVWDDLVTDKTVYTEEARERLINFWSTYAETRVEPGGLIVLCGQRLDGDDLYRHVLDLTAGDDWTDLDAEIGREDEPRKYHHIVYPAHDDEKCSNAQPNPDHKLDAAPWPDGCLLDPKRLSWKKLAGIRANKAERYMVVYQQQDTDPATALVKQEWIDGGRSDDGIQHPGCKDLKRRLGEIPKDLGPCFSYVTVDPSPSRFWSIQWWLYHAPTEQRLLIDMVRRAMDAPEWLDYDVTANRYSGIAEEWALRAHDLGRPITHMIVEDNAAQRFMLQADYIRKWQSLRSIQLVSHQTNRNKLDAEFGVQMLAPLYMFGRARLPWGDPAAQKAVAPLVKEVTRWPRGATDDCVMSQWFGEFNLPRLYSPNRGNVYRLRPNDYLAAKARRGIA